MIRGVAETRQVFINGVELLPDESLAMRRHSPDGFAWGYGGSGPAQLALALLLHFTKDKLFSSRYYQMFKSDILVPLDIDEDFKLVDSVVTDWVKRRKELNAGNK